MKKQMGEDWTNLKYEEAEFDRLFLLTTIVLGKTMEDIHDACRIFHYRSCYEDYGGTLRFPNLGLKAFQDSKGCC